MAAQPPNSAAAGQEQPKRTASRSLVGQPDAKRPKYEEMHEWADGEAKGAWIKYDAGGEWIDKFKDRYPDDESFTSLLKLDKEGMNRDITITQMKEDVEPRIGGVVRQIIEKAKKVYKEGPPGELAALELTPSNIHAAIEMARGLIQKDREFTTAVERVKSPEGVLLSAAEVLGTCARTDAADLPARVANGSKKVLDLRLWKDKKYQQQKVIDAVQEHLRQLSQGEIPSLSVQMVAPPGAGKTAAVFYVLQKFFGLYIDYGLHVDANQALRKCVRMSVQGDSEIPPNEQRRYGVAVDEIQKMLIGRLLVLLALPETPSPAAWLQLQLHNAPALSMLLTGRLNIPNPDEVIAALMARVQRPFLVVNDEAQVPYHTLENTFVTAGAYVANTAGAQRIRSLLSPLTYACGATNGAVITLGTRFSTDTLKDVITAAFKSTTQLHKSVVVREEFEHVDPKHALDAFVDTDQFAGVRDRMYGRARSSAGFLAYINDHKNQCTLLEHAHNYERYQTTNKAVGNSVVGEITRQLVKHGVLVQKDGGSTCDYSAAEEAKPLALLESMKRHVIRYVAGTGRFDPQVDTDFFIHSGLAVLQRKSDTGAFTTYMTECWVARACVTILQGTTNEDFVEDYFWEELMRIKDLFGAEVKFRGNLLDYIAAYRLVAHNGRKLNEVLPIATGTCPQWVENATLRFRRVVLDGDGNLLARVVREKDDTTFVIPIEAARPDGFGLLKLSDSEYATLGVGNKFYTNSDAGAFHDNYLTTLPQNFFHVKRKHGGHVNKGYTKEHEEWRREHTALPGARICSWLNSFPSKICNQPEPNCALFETDLNTNMQIYTSTQQNRLKSFWQRDDSDAAPCAAKCKNGRPCSFKVKQPATMCGRHGSKKVS